MEEQEKKRVFGTTEWAVANANFQSGCENDCKYCYAKSIAVRYKRKSTSNWKNEDVNLTKVNKRFKKENGIIMFPSSHDISIENLDYSITFLWNMLQAGNEVLVVSKPQLDVVKRLCAEFLDFKEEILFRFTVGSVDSETLRFWEPGASTYEIRKECLKYAFDYGYKTSVSCEPMLDNNVITLVDELLPFISDSIWIGKANHLKSRILTNGCYDKETRDRADQLIKSQSDDFIKELYIQLCKNPKIKWKESIKKIVGLDIPTTAGLDV